MIDFRSKRARRMAAVILALAILPSLWFGARTYGSLLLLRSAQELGAPAVSSVRGWMTLRYVATTFHVPADALVARLNLPPATALETTVRTLGEQVDVEPFDYVQRVQKAIAGLKPDVSPPAEEGGSSAWFGVSTDAILSALLVYGYPALGLTLFLGALGAPVPTGLATTLAGSLAGRGQLYWLAAAGIAIAASAIGDIVGYGIGRWLGKGFVARHGKWLGLTPSRQARVQTLFDRWGGVTVLLTRTLVSHLSSVMSLLAGVARYRFASFIAFAMAGRVIWTSAYLGLGYGVGSDIEAASTFLANFSGLVLSLAVLAASAFVAAGKGPARKPGSA
jgi:membrane protein DedA with SNARE-associated domain